MAIHYGIIADFLNTKNDPAFFDGVPGSASGGRLLGPEIAFRDLEQVAGGIVEVTWPDRVASLEPHCSPLVSKVSVLLV